MIVGYARVSTAGQSLDGQVAALEAAGADRVYREVASGAGRRTQLDAALSFVREGDELVVVSLDRLGRRMVELVQLVDELTARGVRFRSLREAIDPSTDMGRAMLAILAVFAETERRVLVERTRAGLEAARAAGRRGGRRPSIGPAKLKRARELLAAEGATVAGVARALGVSRPALYRALPDEIRSLSGSSGSTGRP